MCEKYGPYSATLPCGLEIHHLHDPAATACSVQVWYRVGCTHEEPGQRGIAHLMEHMMFKGTEKVAPEEHARIIQRLGGQANAFTTEDVTAYYQTLPAEHYREALFMEADRMGGLLLPEDHFLKERSVVLEEYRERILNQPITRILQKVRRLLFKDHPYAVDPAGIPEHVEALTRDDLISFYRKYYCPGNAVLISAGPQEFSEVEELTSEAFSFGQNQGEKPPPVPAFTDLPHEPIINRSPVKVNFFTKVYFLPPDKKQFHKLQILNLLLGDGETAVLRREIERKHVGVLHAGCFHYPTRAGDLFFVFVAVLPFLGFRRMVKKLENIMSGSPPISNDSLEEVKGRIRIALASQLTGTERKAAKLGESAVQRDDPEAINTDDERFSAVTREEICEAFESLKKAPNTTITLKASWSRGDR